MFGRRLSRRIVGIGLVAVMGATSVGLISPTHAHALFTSSRDCTTTGTWTFEPALNTVNQMGNIAVTYTADCVDDDGGVIGREPQYTSGFTLGYYGSCATADLTSTDTGEPYGTLTGGVFHEFSGARNGWNVTTTTILAPVVPCAEGTVTAVGYTHEVK